MGMSKNIRQALLLLLCAAVQGCGTDAFTLLREDEALTWQAELILAESDNLPIEIEEAFDRVAAEKIESCRPIYRSIKQRIESEVLGERPSPLTAFGKDFMLLVARIAPTGPLESCAEAYERYQAQFLVLRERADRDQTAY